MALPIFAITIFVSAFLLFLIQPLIAKLILPSLGGTPQVWNTCMVFFQSVLLLGYAYTHSVSTRLKLRQQLLVHSCLLALPILTMLVFPIYTTVKGTPDSPGWSPPAGANPILQTLGLLALIVGIPFFVVSTSAPLLQKWFSYSGHSTAKDPYYLYSVSNLGSLLSLFFYPVLLEPFSLLRDQTYVWFGGYAVLACLVFYCAYTIFKLAPPDEQIMATEAAAAAAAESRAAPTPAVETPALAPTPAAAPAAASTAVKPGLAPGARGIHRKKGKHGHVHSPAAKSDEPSISRPTPQAPTVVRGAAAEMTWWRRVRWVLLAAVPSSMMLGVTSYVSTDLSPFTYVWIVPLTLYLLSFIIVYERWIKWTSKRYHILGAQPGYTLHQMMVYIGQPIGILILCFIAMTGRFDVGLAIILIMLGFFTNALACHGELAEDRPDTKHLTEYFLLMSVGGMVGGLFNGIIAPVVFQHGVLEFYIVIAVACMVRPLYVASGWFDELVLQAFPGFQNWVRNQGDEMAKSMGRPAPRTTWLFSAFLDVVLGAFVLSIAWWLKTTEWRASVFKTLKVTQDWVQFTSNLWLFGAPMAFCFFFAGRPARMGLAVTGLLLGFMYFGGRDDRSVLETKRTYFGLLRVAQSFQYPLDEEEKILFRRDLVKNEETGKMELPPFRYTFLMHGTTYHGRNYYYQKDKDLSRLATTYYHRYGPVGIVLERDNWFAMPSDPMPDRNPNEAAPGRQNDFSADLRLPAALVGDLMASAGTGFNPLWTAATECWSEPPLATIGLGTGTMASYSRPYQHFTYYEIDDAIKGFNLPESGESAYFTFLQNAIRRGVNMELIMGDARQSLNPGRENDNLKNAFVYHAKFDKIEDSSARCPRSYGNAPIKYSSREALAPKDRDNLAPRREKYYKAINVDAFSSDAIPVHLVTKQAIEIYLSKIRDDGVLMVHTSNRHMDLVRPVARIAMELSKESVKNGGPEILCLVGKDDGSTEDPDQRRRETFYMGHYGSEYVMIFRNIDPKTSDGKSDPEAKRVQNFGEWQKYLAAKKVEFTKNRAAVKDKKDITGMMMKADGHAPEGWQILNATLTWFDPFEDHFIELRDGRRYQSHRKVTVDDALWTDDFSHILSVVRWHMPWPFN